MQDKITFGIIGLLAGIILAWLIGTNSAMNKSKMYFQDHPNSRSGQKEIDKNYEGQNFSSSANMGMHGAMGGMMQGLENKTGEAFDQAFLSEMIVHHQGAVEMANQALQKASREEIKTMSKNIISAQNKEIEQMQAWQKQWFGK